METHNSLDVETLDPELCRMIREYWKSAFFAGADFFYNPFIMHIAGIGGMLRAMWRKKNESNCY